MIKCLSLKPITFFGEGLRLKLNPNTVLTMFNLLLLPGLVQGLGRTGGHISIFNVSYSHGRIITGDSMALSLEVGWHGSLIRRQCKTELWPELKIFSNIRYVRSSQALMKGHSMPKSRPEFLSHYIPVYYTERANTLRHNVL